MNVEELKQMCDKLECEIKECEKDLKKVGSLTIKTQSFFNLLSKQDENNKEIKLLKIKANALQKSVKILGEKRTALKNELEQEMIDSKIRPQKILEVTQNNSIEEDKQFFANQSSKLDEFISISMDSLDSLKKQAKYIDNISSKLRQGLLKMGVNNNIINKVEERFAGDKSIFYILLFLVVVLILILKFGF